jgi:SAM-dependent methyltransferase
MSSPETALDLALPRLLCPRCGAALERMADGVRCRSGHLGRLRAGVLDLLGRVERLSLGQRWFATELGARAYERFRESSLADLITGQRWSDEVGWLIERLRSAEPEWVLDVPCGQGNFTAAIARELGVGVIGLDLSARMLELAARRARRERLDRVALVRGDALALPLARASVDAISTCGGLHLYPDVPAAIAEMRRVLRTGGVVAGLTFRRPAATPALVGEGLRFGGVRAFDFDALGGLFREQGFGDYRWHGRRLVGWFSARAPR